MDLQHKYERILKDARSFCAQSLSKLDKHDFASRVEKFIEDHQVLTEESHMDRFTNDLVRRLRKVAVTHSKESLSKLVHFLDNCPEKFEDYRD